MAIIERVILEHQIIRRHVQGAQSSATDYEALFSLQQAQSGLAQSTVAKLSEQKARMEESFHKIEIGLDRHFNFEEEALPPLFGPVFMKALVYEHTEIRQFLRLTLTQVAADGLAGLNQAAALEHKSDLQETTTRLSDMIETHANLEEQILRMLKKAFLAEQS